MSPRSVDALPLAFFLLVAAGPAAGIAVGVPDAGAGAPAAPGASSPAVAPHNGTLPPPEQIIRIDLKPRGNARWHVSVRIPLETRNDTAAFRDLAARFEAGNTDTLAVDTFEEAAARAGTESGRTMRIRDIERSHSVEEGTGVLMLSFTWTNFAETDGDRLIVGDAFNTTTGTWLPYLTDRQTLLVAPPEGYGVRSSPPVAVESGVARWNGPVEFSGRGPWIVYAGNAGTETVETPTTGGPGTGTGPGNDDGSGSLLLLVASLGGGVVLIVAYFLRRADGVAGPAADDRDDGSGAGASGTGETDTAAGTASEPAAEGTDEGVPESGGSAGEEAAGSGAGATAEGDETEEEEIDVTLLSDEERVERLLERNGGRMKQASIVKETGWSNAKVSQLLSSMEEEGRIDKLRIGRENLISFPEEDITDFDSG